MTGIVSTISKGPEGMRRTGSSKMKNTFVPTQFVMMSARRCAQ